MITNKLSMSIAAMHVVKRCNVCLLEMYLLLNSNPMFLVFFIKQKKNNPMIKIYRTEKWFPTVSHESDTRNRKFLKSPGLLMFKEK